jgi:hypothetical protein
MILSNVLVVVKANPKTVFPILLIDDLAQDPLFQIRPVFLAGQGSSGRLEGCER